MFVKNIFSGSFKQVVKTIAVENINIRNLTFV